MTHTRDPLEEPAAGDVWAGRFGQVFVVRCDWTGVVWRFGGSRVERRATFGEWADWLRREGARCHRRGQ